MIVINFLKWLGQYSNSIQVLAMAMIFWRHVLSLIMHLRCSHNSLSELGADKLLHLTMVLVNSFSKNGGHNEELYGFNLFNTFSSTWRNWAILNEEWRACQSSSNSKHRWPLYLIILMAERLHLLTQLMSSQGPCFLLAISWILWSKKAFFVSLTIFQKVFQSLIFFKDLYLARSLLQSLFYQLLECFIMLMIFEFFIHTNSVILAKSVMTFSHWYFPKMFDVSNFAKDAITFLMNKSSSSLFLIIVLFWRSIFILVMEMVIINSTWLEMRY